MYRFIYLNNFREIVPGVLYRSGQPSIAEVQIMQDEYNLKSIINLRGGRKPYIKELLDYAQNNGIQTQTYRLSSDRQPSREEILSIIDFIDKAPKPLLIHCLRGVDRTGLVSTIALIINNYPIDTALDQFSWDKGFLPYRPQEIQRLLIQDYNQWLIGHHYTSNKNNFINWVTNHYQQKRCDYSLGNIYDCKPVNNTA